MEIFSIVGAIYLVMVSFATWGLNYLEDRIAIPGFERPKILLKKAENYVHGTNRFALRRWNSFL